MPIFRLEVGLCMSCTMVQQLNEVPAKQMFRADYPYRASGSAVIRKHAESVAEQIVKTRPGGENGFVVEIGCNDGVMLKTLSKAGVRHLGVDPAASAGDVARAHGARVRTDFFDKSTAAEILDEDGQAHLIYSATRSATSRIPTRFSAGWTYYLRRTGCSCSRIAILARSRNILISIRYMTSTSIFSQFVRCRRRQLISAST